MAISPGIILVPSDMKILDEMMPGYNNILTLTTESMKFGANPNLNYTGKVGHQVVPHQENKPSNHLDTLIDHKDSSSVTLR